MKDSTSQDNTNFDITSVNYTDIAIDTNLNIENERNWEEILAEYTSESTESNIDTITNYEIDLNPPMQPQILSIKPDEEQV